MIKSYYSLLLGLLFYSQNLLAQLNTPYQRPVTEIQQLLDAPSTPLVSLSPDCNWMVLYERADYPSIEAVSRLELRLAGTRIDPNNFGPSRNSYYVGVKLKNVKNGQEFTITGLPQPLMLSNVSWAPNSKQLAFTQGDAEEIALWVIDVAEKTARRLGNRAVNDVMGSTYNWLSDSRSLLFSAVPLGRGPAPKPKRVPVGPVIEENLGKKAPSRTYQDLLKNGDDEALFSYYASVDLVQISLEGEEKILLQNQLLTSYSSSPDGRFILTKTLKLPFSYLVPFSRFPTEVAIYAITGEKLKTIIDIPLTDYIPSAFNAVEKTPRSHGWRSDAAATLYWVEALDGGDPKQAAEYRDRLMQILPPFDGKPLELIRIKLRFSGVMWGNQTTAMVAGRWWNNRTEEVYLLNPLQPALNKKIRTRNYEDAYGDPGNPLMQPNAYGRSVLYIHNNQLFLTGAGSSPEGDLPFLDQYDLKTGKSKRLWQCEAPYYENVVALLDPAKKTFISSRESQQENPNYYLRTVGSTTLKALTNFPNPYPQLKKVHKEQLRYKRNDGVELTATLYLPADYDKSKGPLPTLIWAYPREFKSQSAASQVKGSKYTFTRISSGSPIFWVMRGYAVVDNASMPIVGEGDLEPNDTYIKQLVANAAAIVDYMSESGQGDKNRMAIGGHSYGAFMTANLMAHSNLFKAGIARSGAYNRTLTPFGFQAEERTYWQAPEVYFQMSPFSFADKIKTPLLLIHGEADNNPGTFPIQSERLYNAIKGHGGTVRYVVLPHESHGYRAKESVEHMLWEMDNWLAFYLK